MAYGVDRKTEVGYVYKKSKVENAVTPEYDGVPDLATVLWEGEKGNIFEEQIDSVRGKSIADAIVKKKPKMEFAFKGSLLHSGDGTIPYLSLSWAHTWLLHAIRAKRNSGGTSPGGRVLDDVEISHRPAGAMEWERGPPPSSEGQDSNDTKDTKKKKGDDDTGTNHPHGTKYKPEMLRYHNVGRSRRTTKPYSTTVIEATGVEHKETTRYGTTIQGRILPVCRIIRATPNQDVSNFQSVSSSLSSLPSLCVSHTHGCFLHCSFVITVWFINRNYDILAAVFTDVLKHMHDDYGIV